MNTHERWKYSILQKFIAHFFKQRYFFSFENSSPFIDKFMLSMASQKLYEIKKGDIKRICRDAKHHSGFLVRRSLFDLIHNNKCDIKYLHILFGANRALHIMAWQSYYKNPYAWFLVDNICVCVCIWLSIRNGSLPWISYHAHIVRVLRIKKKGKWIFVFQKRFFVLLYKKAARATTANKTNPVTNEKRKNWTRWNMLFWICEYLMNKNVRRHFVKSVLLHTYFLLLRIIEYDHTFH